MTAMWLTQKGLCKFGWVWSSLNSPDREKCRKECFGKCRPQKGCRGNCLKSVGVRVEGVTPSYRGFSPSCQVISGRQTGLTYCGVQKWLPIRFYYLRDVFRNCFTGLGRLGKIDRDSGVSTENERRQPALRGMPRITGLTPVRLIYCIKLQDRAFFRNN